MSINNPMRPDLAIDSLYSGKISNRIRLLDRGIELVVDFGTSQYVVDNIAGKVTGVHIGGARIRGILGIGTVLRGTGRWYQILKWVKSRDGKLIPKVKEV